MELQAKYPRYALAIASGVALAVSMASPSAAAEPLAAPADFALADIEGSWHILAHIPYSLERNRVAPTIRFEPRGDGKYHEYFTSRKGSFSAEPKTFKQVTWAPDPSRPWELKTRVFVVIPARYQVLAFDKARGIALLGTQKRDKAWIFSRSPTMDAATYEQSLLGFAERGFDAQRILRIPQEPGDLGKPGYAPIED